MKHTTEEGRTVHELRSEMEKGIGLLKTLRDEIRVELHLAKLEAKQRWETSLEPRIRRIEAEALKAKKASKDVVDEVVREVKQFRDELATKR